MGALKLKTFRGEFGFQRNKIINQLVLTYLGLGENPAALLAL